MTEWRSLLLWLYTGQCYVSLVVVTRVRNCEGTPKPGEGLVWLARGRLVVTYQLRSLLEGFSNSTCGMLGAFHFSVPERL
jgi:hypothetical protein